MKTTEIACRVCGCTANNCAKCIEKTGAPCWWTKNGTCSACVPRFQAIGSLLDYVMMEALEASRGLAFISVFIDVDGTGHIGSSAVGAQGDMIMSELRERVVAGFGVKDTPGRTQVATLPPVPAPTDTAQCLHCGKAMTVEEGRKHMLVCEKSPLAQEFAAAKNRIAELEVQLADVAFERNQLQAEHERSLRHG